jgi:hypothetical protein
MKRPNEFEKFDKTMEQLLRVPHSQIKAELDAERAEKVANAERRRKSAKSKDAANRR